MAELTGPTSTCCAAEAQATCCEPSHKSACCGTSAVGGSCGCSAGQKNDQPDCWTSGSGPTHQVHKHATAATVRARKPEEART